MAEYFATVGDLRKAIADVSDDTVLLIADMDEDLFKRVINVTPSDRTGVPGLELEVL